jgi:hypothetical protein
MGSEYDAMNLVPAPVNFYVFLVCLGVFRLIISFEQHSDELRLWYHHWRYRRFLKTSRRLRL